MLTGAAAVLTYVYALLHVVSLESDYEECTRWRSGGYGSGAEYGRFLGLEDGILPPKAVCRWGDGFTMNHVPQSANQLLLVIAIVLVALASARAISSSLLPTPARTTETPGQNV